MAKKKAAGKTVSKPVKKSIAKPKYRIAPLSSGFAIVSIVGIIVSAFLIARSPSWGVAFLIVFLVMFIASLRSMRYGPIGRI